MEKMELSEALKANASVLEELMPIANLGSKGLLRKGVLSPILVFNKDSVQEVCVVRLASSSNALYRYDIVCILGWFYRSVLY